MEVCIQKLPHSKVELKIEVPFEEFERATKKAFFSLSETLDIRGFRKGHIPQEIIEKEVGEAEILNRAAEIAIKENYPKAILENKIEVISQPEIEILKLPGLHPTHSGARPPECFFEFKVQVQVLPQVSLPDYKSIASKIKRHEVQVEEKDIEEALTWLQKSRAKFFAVLHPARKGDFVEIEFSSPDIENGKQRKDAFILDKGHFIPGFEENLEGMETGQEKKFALTFPEKHSQKELSGKKVSFKVKIISIQKVELPEINDEFARNLGRFESLAKLQESIKQEILKEKQRKESSRTWQEILENITREINCEVPEILAFREKEMMMYDLKQRISQNLKMAWEDYLSSIKKTEEEILQSFSSEAERRVKEFLVLREISRKENIEVSEEEVKEQINELLGQYPDIDRAKKELDLEKLKDYTKETLRNKKVFQLLEGLAIGS